MTLLQQIMWWSLGLCGGGLFLLEFRRVKSMLEWEDPGYFFLILSRLVLIVGLIMLSYGLGFTYR